MPDRSYANLVLGVESGCAIPGGSRTGAADAHAGAVPPGQLMLYYTELGTPAKLIICAVS